MKTARHSGVLSLAILSALASPGAMADNTGWYVGASGGQSQATIDDERITSGLLAAGFGTDYIIDDDRDTAYKGFLGYQFSRHFAVEAGYVDFGQFGFEAGTDPPGTLTGVIKLRGVHLDALGILPLGEHFSAFVRAGAIRAKAEDSFTGTGFVNVLDPNPSKTDTHYKFGAGMQYNFNESLGMRLEAERYRIDDAVGNIGDIDLLSLGVVYYFGGGSEPYVASAEPTAPMPPQRSCADLDDDGDGVNNCNDKCPASQAGQAIGPDGCPVPLTIDLKGVNFDFDRDTLRPDALVILDEAIAILQKYPQMRFEVAGHTDAIGSDDYNQDLSERRARVVYDYLGSHGIDASRMAGPNGYGESRPIAPNSNEDGSDNPEGRAKNRRTELNVEN